MTRRVDICVATFRRPEVVDTLRSLSTQRMPEDLSFRVIVADNDSTPSAEAGVRQAARRLGLNLLYLHAPERNISVARNAALDAAEAPWVAILDDDEAADPAWLSSLLKRAGETGAEIVLGPVHPVYGPRAPAWMRAGRFHETRPVEVRGRIVTGYTCNVLFRRNARPTRGMRFLERLGRCGGEDTEFFDRLVRHGARIAYADDAIVREAVPPERARLGWLLRRRYRFGQSHGALLAARAGSPGRRLARAALAASKAAFSLCGALVSLPWPARRAFWLLRAALHAGVVARLFGRGEIELYGNDGSG